jgi:hypothetical protein
VSREQIEQARAESLVYWDGTIEYWPEQAYFTIEERQGYVYLQVIFDMTYFTDADVEAILHGVEEVAVQAAFDPTVATRASGHVALEQA